MDKQLAIDLASFRTLEKLGYKYNGGEYWKPPLSTIGATKPVFTQAMQEAGELPSVGMEVMIKNKCDAHPQLKRATIKYMGDLVVYSYVENGERCDSNINLVFRPLTPPIELIDGKAYQFDIMHIKNGVIGIYSASDDEFIYLENVCRPDDCTNIKLLEVK